MEIIQTEEVERAESGPLSWSYSGFGLSSVRKVASNPRVHPEGSCVFLLPQMRNLRLMEEKKTTPGKRATGGRGQAEAEAWGLAIAVRRETAACGGST